MKLFVRYMGVNIRFLPCRLLVVALTITLIQLCSYREIDGVKVTLSCKRQSNAPNLKDFRESTSLNSAVRQHQDCARIRSPSHTRHDMVEKNLYSILTL